MKTSHTSGPWRTVKITTAKTVIRCGHETICEVHRFMGSPALMNRDGEGEANARLIASAPELLAALEGLLGQEDWTRGEDIDPRSPIGLARAALAKAKGQE